MKVTQEPNHFRNITITIESLEEFRALRLALAILQDRSVTRIYKGAAEAYEILRPMHEDYFGGDMP